LREVPVFAAIAHATPPTPSNSVGASLAATEEALISILVSLTVRR
jgi:hypothetical protein